MPTPEEWKAFCASEGIDRGRLADGKSLPEDPPARSYVDQERRRYARRMEAKDTDKKQPVKWWRKINIAKATK